MSAARARKVLIAAFAISLLVHFLLAGYVRWPVFEQSRAEPVAKVHIMRIARIPPRTPPPATPAPTPAATPLVHASIAPPPIKPHPGKGPARVSTVIPVHVSTPAPRITIAPTPVATATPSGPCGGHANSDPTVASTPDTPDLTPQARASKVNGTAAIHVLLDPAGHVTDATVAQSSGNAGLDNTALQMARSAAYTPKYVDCRAVAGDYTFTVKFVAW
jgi:protein TonB